MALTSVSFILLLTVYVTANGNCSESTYGPGCRYKCQCGEDIFCNPLSGCNGNCAAGWDGNTCQRQNVALGGTTSQSTTYPGFNPPLTSSGAVDGKVGHSLSLPCSQTNEYDPSPSWTVTLKQTYIIYRFRIYNRGEGWGFRLNGFTLSVRTSSGDYSVCYQDYTTSSGGPGNIVDGTCQNGSPISGNTVQIRNSPYGYVALCEVLLYVCSDGTYGEECQHYCGECRDSYVCNKLTGVCPDTGGDRCKPRFTGDKCKDCVDGRWGEDCSSSCGNCYNGNNCAMGTGECPGIPKCAAGYKGNNCDEECDDGYWGVDCSRQCGQCRVSTCDKKNGNCQVEEGHQTCVEGYKGIRCMESNCSQSTYGPGCRYKCHCGIGILCNPFSGCNGNCAAGWDGNTCQRQNAALGGTTSQSTTYPGFDPPLSSSSAVDGKDGHSLSLPCSQTNQNDPSPSWTVTLNQTYNIYRFRIYNRGEGWGFRLNGFTLSVGTSSGDYSVCYQDNTTSPSGPGNIVDGTCQNGSPISGNTVQIRNRPNGYVALCEVLLYVCSPYWYGEFCQMECLTKDRCKSCDDRGLYCGECVSGRWGEHCALPCGNCWNDTCVKETGECPLVKGNRCQAGYKGYKGTNCTAGCEAQTWGPDCGRICGKCFNDGVCDAVSGKCPITENPTCFSGYEPPLCRDDCTSNKWGPDCTKICGHCYDNTPCNPRNGGCPVLFGKPICGPGYHGSFCETSCVPGRYGPNCTESCGYCADGPTSCDSVTGDCPKKQGHELCANGYSGEICKTESTTDTGLIVGCVAGVVVLVLIVAVVILLYKRRSSSHHENNIPSDVTEARATSPEQDIVMRTISREIDTPNYYNTEGKEIDTPNYYNTEGKEDSQYESIPDHEYEKVRLSRNKNESDYSTLS